MICHLCGNAPMRGSHLCRCCADAMIVEAGRTAYVRVEREGWAQHREHNKARRARRRFPVRRASA